MDIESHASMLIRNFLLYKVPLEKYFATARGLTRDEILGTHLRSTSQ